MKMIQLRHSAAAVTAAGPKQSVAKTEARTTSSESRAARDSSAQRKKERKKDHVASSSALSSMRNASELKCQAGRQAADEANLM